MQYNIFTRKISPYDSLLEMKKLGFVTKKFHVFPSCLLSILILIVVVLFSTNIVSATEIISVQSISIKPYNNALNGFMNACDCNIEKYVVSEMKGIDIIKKIRREKPELIVAIGNKALLRVSEIKNIPIVSLMVLNPQSLISDNDNITGVDLFIPPAKQLFEINKVIPHIKTIGLLFDPSRTGNYAKDALIASKSVGIRLIAKEVKRSQDVPSILKSMRDDIDAFWMIPDLTVVTPDIVEFLSLFSLENNIPLITFSKNYLKMGALISFDIDSVDMGRQAWEIADKILSGTVTKHINMSYARTLNVTINHKIVKNFGMIAINNMLIRAVADNR